MADDNYTNQDYFSLVEEVNDRVRILESRYNLMRERMLMINQNMVDEYKNLLEEIKLLNEEIKEIKESMFTIKDAMYKIVNELNLFAKKEDLKILEKYINLWDPLKFVTEEQVLKLIEEKHGKGKKRTHEKS